MERQLTNRRGARAVGVEYVFDKQVYPDAEQTVHTVHASRLVVVSAGAMGSSLILERSGIGAATILEKFGIQQVVDLPGVGKDYDGKWLACSGNNCRYIRVSRSSVPRNTIYCGWEHRNI